MQYTNHHTRLNSRPDLNPALLRRIMECRRRSRKARTHAEKIAMAERGDFKPSHVHEPSADRGLTALSVLQ